MDVDLSGRVAVVTGAGSGVGRALTCLLAGAGATVVAAGRREAACADTASLAGSDGGRVYPFVADVADAATLQQLLVFCEEVAGGPDIVVGSAGVLPPAGLTWEVEPDEWAANVQANLVGAFNTARTFLRGMVERDRGVLVLVSSVAARLATPGWGAYAAAKAGVDQLVRTVQAELDARGSSVSVYALYPGVVDTPMQELVRSFSPEEFPNVEAFRRMHEKGRLRPPEQPASLALWLAAGRAPDLRGQVADLDDAEIRARLSADLGLAPF